jgi:glycosyltransferase involved in cell wall biosynthesis
VVINEAMNFSLPIVASNVVGSTADLVEHGVNGFLFAPGDIESLADFLRTLIRDPESRAAMGKESARRIAAWDFDRGLEGVLAALRTVARHAACKGTSDASSRS